MDKKVHGIWYLWRKKMKCHYNFGVGIVINFEVGIVITAQI